MKTSEKRYKRLRRHKHIRKRIKGSQASPRMCVFRSSKHIYAQLINDENAQVLTSSSTLDNAVSAEIKGKTKLEAAAIVGKDIANKAKDANIGKIVFDRGGFRFHGRVKALADAAREAGLEF